MVKTNCDAAVMQLRGLQKQEDWLANTMDNSGGVLQERLVGVGLIQAESRMRSLQLIW